MNILNEISLKPSFYWPSFLNEEFISVINKCNNLSTPGSDRISWKLVKAIVKDIKYLKNIEYC